MTRFETGQEYTYFCWNYRVVKRTPCYVTFEFEDTSPWGSTRTKSKRFKVHEFEGTEYVYDPVMMSSIEAA